MPLTNAQIKTISEYLNYPYSRRSHLKEILDGRSTEWEESWDTEVSELLEAIATAKTSWETSLREGEIKREEIVGEIEIEYREGNAELQGLKTMYYNLLGELFKLIELNPLPSSNYLVR